MRQLVANLLIERAVRRFRRRLVALPVYVSVWGEER